MYHNFTKLCNHNNKKYIKYTYLYTYFNKIYILFVNFDKIYNILVIYKSLMNIKNPLFLKKLEKVNLTDKEALVYLSILELGGAYPSRIAEYSGLNRSTAYKILLNLSVRGLVNEIEKRNKLFYQVEKPDRLIKDTENRLQWAKKSLDLAKKIIPEINEIYGQFGGKPKITYNEGVEGIKTIYEDHLAVSESYEMLAWADTTEVKDFLPKTFFNEYVKSKESIGITTRGIIQDTIESRQFNNIRYKDIKKSIWPNIRFTSKKKFPMTGEVVVYGKNKVSIVNLSRTNSVGTIIEDEKIHNMMKTIFNICWESSAIKK